MFTNICKSCFCNVSLPNNVSRPYLNPDAAGGDPDGACGVCCSGSGCAAGCACCGSGCACACACGVGSAVDPDVDVCFARLAFGVTSSSQSSKLSRIIECFDPCFVYWINSSTSFSTLLLLFMNSLAVSFMKFLACLDSKKFKNPFS